MWNGQRLQETSEQLVRWLRLGTYSTILDIVGDISSQRRLPELILDLLNCPVLPWMPRTQRAMHPLNHFFHNFERTNVLSTMHRAGAGSSNWACWISPMISHWTGIFYKYHLRTELCELQPFQSHFSLSHFSSFHIMSANSLFVDSWESAAWGGTSVTGTVSSMSAFSQNVPFGTKIRMESGTWFGWNCIHYHFN